MSDSTYMKALIREGRATAMPGSPGEKTLADLRAWNTFRDSLPDEEMTSFADDLFERLSSREMAIRTTRELMSLRERMRSDIVHFRYDKKDGSDRPAYGTRCGEIIARYGAIPRSGGPLPKRLYRAGFNYFDLEKKAWRCFKPENFVSMDMKYAI